MAAGYDISASLSGSASSAAASRQSTPFQQTFDNIFGPVNIAGIGSNATSAAPGQKTNWLLIVGIGAALLAAAYYVFFRK